MTRKRVARKKVRLISKAAKTPRDRVRLQSRTAEGDSATWAWLLISDDFRGVVLQHLREHARFCKYLAGEYPGEPGEHFTLAPRQLLKLADHYENPPASTVDRCVSFLRAEIERNCVDGFHGLLEEFFLMEALQLIDAGRAREQALLDWLSEPVGFDVRSQSLRHYVCDVADGGRRHELAVALAKAWGGSRPGRPTTVVPDGVVDWTAQTLKRARDAVAVPCKKDDATLVQCVLETFLDARSAAAETVQVARLRHIHRRSPRELLNAIVALRLRAVSGRNFGRETVDRVIRTAAQRQSD
jgi:hypothetical protein